MAERRPVAQRVIVSGIGAVSGWGWGAHPLWEGFSRGQTAVGPFQRFDHADYPTHVASEVRAPRPVFPGGARLPFADAFAVWATIEALRQAELPGDLSSLRVGLYFGGSTGGMVECEEWYEGLAGRPIRELSARRLETQQVASPADAAARHVRATGPVETVSSACASATLAIENALDAIRDGTVDIAIAGGADSLCRVTYAGFNSLQAVDTHPSRPFRADRRGLSLGEGAGVLILERQDHARARAVRPLAELCGAGSSSDAHHMTAPHPEGAGAAIALERAFADAGMEPAEVDFVNTHGTGTELNDLAEYAALGQVLGDRVDRIPFVCPKASIGHLLGSAGAIEAVLTVQILNEQILPATPGAGAVDPRTPVEVLRDEPVSRPGLDVGVTLNLGFGGCNGALLFRRGRDS